MESWRGAGAEADHILPCRASPHAPLVLKFVCMQDIPPQDLHGPGNAVAAHLHHAMRTLMGDFTDRRVPKLLR